jgi:hypothetical protein
MIERFASSMNSTRTYQPHTNTGTDAQQANDVSEADEKAEWRVQQQKR